ncbi:MAG: YigZ family protein [Melioribacteraceae bacterium]|nr:YigZ family protein [Melioribacteraceae bacterium]
MNEIKESIKIITTKCEFRFKEKGSEFIALSFYIESEEEALEKLNSIKKKFYDAVHHCYAYSINYEKSKYSDDGEPNGTAGIRIFNAINHFELTNIIVIVVRYFGGVKLGVGPLGKAYYFAAEQLLSQSPASIKSAYQRLEIFYNYEQVSRIHYLINQNEAIIEKMIYEPELKMVCLVLISKIGRFVTELIDFSGGSIKTKLLSEIKYL